MVESSMNCSKLQGSHENTFRADSLHAILNTIPLNKKTSCSQVASHPSISTIWNDFQNVVTKINVNMVPLQIDSNALITP